ncbi:hypothetical protein F7U66_24700 [Vibrio parahaemolyticus]|nr:hypothetical protein [Vibrio parahaemolyticus]
MDISKQLTNWANIQSLFCEFERFCINQKSVEFESDIPEEKVFNFLKEEKKLALNEDFLMTLISGECAFYAIALKEFFNKYPIDCQVMAGYSEAGTVTHYFLQLDGPFGRRYVDGAGAYSTTDEILNRYTVKSEKVVKVCIDDNEDEYQHFTDAYSWALDMCESEELLKDDEEQECTVSAFDESKDLHYCDVFDIFCVYAVHQIMKEM